MSVNTEPYTNGAAQAREATEKSVETWKQGAKTFTEQVERGRQAATVDLTEPVARYFEYVQKSVDLNRDLATRWAELVTSLSGTVREQAEKVTASCTGPDRVGRRPGRHPGREGRGGRERAGRAGRRGRRRSRNARPSAPSGPPPSRPRSRPGSRTRG